MIEWREGDPPTEMMRPQPVAARMHRKVPLVGASAPAGFPSPADDCLDRPLDFNELLIENPEATFAVRIVGDSMVAPASSPGTSRWWIAAGPPPKPGLMLVFQGLSGMDPHSLGLPDHGRS
jgi:Peptidase S24-like